MLFAIAFSLVALAQDAPTSGSVFDDSLSPVLENLVAVATKMEENNVQITDLVIGVVSDDGLGISIPVTLPGDADVILVAVGDERRIKDLDMGVQGTDGLSGSDQLDDNMPQVNIHTTYSGEYTAKVVISEPIEGSAKGYFLFVTGFPRDHIIALALPVLENTQLVVNLAESQGLRFVHGDMETLVADRSAMIEAPIPQGVFANCFAIAVTSPDRTKRAFLSVEDAGGNTLATAKKGKNAQIAMTGFVNSEENPRHFLHIGAKMDNGYSDSLGLGMVACAPN